MFKLDADPGSLIQFSCYNNEAWTYGAGCFIINEKCYCYNFDNIDNKEYSKTEKYSGEVKFENNKTCNIEIKFLKEFNKREYYSYQHYIPLDVNEIECIKDNYIMVPNNMEYIINFSDYIKSPFNLTNLNISIEKNSEYFTLNKTKLNSTTKFKITNNLTFLYKKGHKKIKIKFKNYGVFLEDTKSCELGIRVCYDSCLECKDKDPDNTYTNGYKQHIANNVNKTYDNTLKIM